MRSARSTLARVSANCVNLLDVRSFRFLLIT
nr:MAG TPA: hypothetical protein [Caudoviricetes sp.]